ncbi:MAG: hypothetical protein OJF50_001510 [Nitrospira sp.]|jgi:metal-responsive CopG/Arc/MetJ family transcriptional regulator|nr:hypothetical protein [Nitrospira sp.]
MLKIIVSYSPRDFHGDGHNGEVTNEMERVLIHIPKRLNATLDAERKRGTSAAELIRHLLEEYFKGKKAAELTRNKGGY